ncbi:MAG: NlpC/P60 family protein [Clostridium sp.]
MVTGNDVVNKARALIGYPYRWGGDSPSEGGFDCSGLVYYVYTSLEISISRTTYTQINDGRKITDKSKLQLGDLIFNFDTEGVAQHVLLYSGNGYVIESKYEGTTISEHNKWTWEGMAVRILKDEPVAPIPQPPNNPTPSNPVVAGTFYRVICGSYKDKANGAAQQAKLKKAGFDSFLALYKDNTGSFYRVVVGSYKDIQNAVDQQAKLKKAGFDSFLIVFKE